MKGRILQVGLLITVASVLVVAGCAPEDDRSPLADTERVLEEYGEPGNLTSALPDQRPTISFDDDTEVTGFTGCNWYGGTYTAAVDGTLEFGLMHQTEIACEPDVMEQETDFMNALRLAQEYEHVNAQLHISGGGKLLVFSASQVTAPPGSVSLETRKADVIRPNRAIALCSPSWQLLFRAAIH